MLSALEVAEQANVGIWLETRTRIRAANGKLIRPRANILQRRLNAYDMACRRKGLPRRGVSVKPRKRGCSTGIGAIHYTDLQKGSIHGVLVGNKSETAEEVLGMMRTYAENDELATRGKWGSIAKWGKEGAVFPHGSRLTISSALGGGSIRGQTPQFVHGTEVAHWEQQSVTLLALLNAVPDDPDTSIWLESTPNGTGDEFEKTWGHARWPTADECPDGVEYWREWERECPNPPDAQEGGFVRIFAAWFEFDTAVSRLEEVQKQRIRETLDAKSWYAGEAELMARFGNVRALDGAQRLGREIEAGDVWEQLAWRRMIIATKCGHDPAKFDQEYPRDPQSCFLASGRKYFDGDAIAHFTRRAAQTNWEFGHIDAANERAVWRPCEAELAPFTRCEHPRIGCAYLISVDSAEGDEQATGKDPDLHSILVHRKGYIDKTSGVFWPKKVVARAKYPCRVPIPACATFIDLLSRIFGRCPAIIEMNNTGLAVLELCRKLGVPLWKRRDINPNNGRTVEKLGWRTTDSSDYSGLRSLILAALHQEISGVPNAEGGTDYLIDIVCQQIVYQLANFGLKDGKLIGLNCHDDDVLSLAIGSYNIEAATVYEDASIIRVPPPEWKHLYGEEGERDLAMNS